MRKLHGRLDARVPPRAPAAVGAGVDVSANGGDDDVGIEQVDGAAEPGLCDAARHHFGHAREQLRPAAPHVRPDTFARSAVAAATATEPQTASLCCG
ncbi:hypothetical protein JGS22_022420 [Streptomyces sp. P38-E01]|uniref:Uncharacterized protein n=1 Tax=Streptomyces tardus TaxID=2780544 RepID=A0A949JQ89_9ACTN|nr:hypothetical protein [Streptomyces tardus]MBU7600309.1 hypothetical protein [Streptomyces tardus]